MTFLFHPEAEAEFNRAIDYYEEVEPGLGFDFAIEVQSAIQRSVTFPKAWPVIEGEIRRCLVRRFPFGVLYSIESGLRGRSPNGPALTPVYSSTLRAVLGWRLQLLHFQTDGLESTQSMESPVKPSDLEIELC